MGKYSWPEVFTEPNYDYAKKYPNMTTKKRRSFALADGLAGWAICMAGEKPPELFGKTMVKIGHLLDITVTPDNLEKYRV